TFLSAFFLSYPSFSVMNGISICFIPLFPLHHAHEQNFTDFFNPFHPSPSQPKKDDPLQVILSIISSTIVFPFRLTFLQTHLMHQELVVWKSCQLQLFSILRLDNRCYLLLRNQDNDLLHLLLLLIFY